MKGKYKIRQVGFPAFWSPMGYGGLVFEPVDVKKLPKKFRNIRKKIWIRDDGQYMAGF